MTSTEYTQMGYTHCPECGRPLMGSTPPKYCPVCKRAASWPAKTTKPKE